MKVKNKWNKREYEVIEKNGNAVKLKRITDGHIFEIAYSEFKFSYTELDK